MPFKETLKDFRSTIYPGILNSYSIIFFLNNRFLSVVLMVVTFFNFYAGLSGLYAVLLALLLGSGMKLDKINLRNGLYSFNALLTGVGMGSFFDPSVVFFSLLTLAAVLSLFLSVTLSGWLNKYKLPHLGIPFVISFWFIILPSAHFENLGLTQRNIYWMNEMYAMGGNSLLSFFQTIDSLPLNDMVDTYLRSLSSIFFQSNLISGLLIAVALLISSRIFFSLSIVGFLSAYVFAQFTGSEAASITYYNIGANYMMVAFAIGGFFVIPSRNSYLWTIFLIPLTSLVLLFFYKLLGFIQLPVFSLPFSFVTILFVYFLQMRTKANNLILTPFQYYSPEANLYAYNNNKDRLARFLYFPIHLPFWGEWTVSQGHDGKYTHLGDWGKAFDFVIQDAAGKSFKGKGLKAEDYYSFNKPVVAAADGVIVKVIDNIEDNEIGSVNTVNNWGNSIIIRHTPDLFSQVSHLKKNSVRVNEGDFVKHGDLLATCGNSGRSPEPHLHFQLQAVPTLGSKTLDYPFAYFESRNEKESVLCQFSRPTVDDKISNVSVNNLLKNAFDILPNSTLKFSYKNEKGVELTEQWTAYTDAYNYKYLYCAETESTAYYVNDGFMFYFTAFYGNENSLLYYFYLSAYKVFLGNESHNLITDSIPLNVLNKNKFSTWLQDIVAPFYNYMQVKFSLNTINTENTINSEFIILKSTIDIQNFRKTSSFSKGLITVAECGIHEIKFKSGNTNIHATCLRD